MKRLTTLNGKINRRWFNARIANGSIEVHEENQNDQSPKYKKVDWTLERWTNFYKDALRVYESDNNKISGALGHSFYYRFFIK